MGKINRSFMERLRARGQIMVIFALLLPIVFGFVGLGIDVGLMYLSKARLSRALDSTSLHMASNYDSKETLEVREEILLNTMRANYPGFLAEATINDFVVDGEKMTIDKRENGKGEYLEMKLETGSTGTISPVKITITAQLNHQTYFMPLFGEDFREVAMGDVSKAERNPQCNILLLDNSGGMVATGANEHMINAVKSFVELFDDSIDYMMVVGYTGRAQVLWPTTRVDKGDNKGLFAPERNFKKDDALIKTLEDYMRYGETHNGLAAAMRDSVEYVERMLVATESASSGGDPDIRKKIQINYVIITTAGLSMWRTYVKGYGFGMEFPGGTPGSGHGTTIGSIPKWHTKHSVYGGEEKFGKTEHGKNGNYNFLDYALDGTLDNENHKTYDMAVLDLKTSNDCDATACVNACIGGVSRETPEYWLVKGAYNKNPGSGCDGIQPKKGDGGGVTTVSKSDAEAYYGGTENSWNDNVWMEWNKNSKRLVPYAHHTGDDGVPNVDADSADAAGRNKITDTTNNTDTESALVKALRSDADGSEYKKWKNAKGDSDGNFFLKYFEKAKLEKGHYDGNPPDTRPKDFNDLDGDGDREYDDAVSGLNSFLTEGLSKNDYPYKYSGDATSYVMVFPEQVQNSDFDETTRSRIEKMLKPSAGYNGGNFSDFFNYFPGGRHYANNYNSFGASTVLFGGLEHGSSESTLYNGKLRPIDLPWNYMGMAMSTVKMSDFYSEFTYGGPVNEAPSRYHENFGGVYNGTDAYDGTSGRYPMYQKFWSFRESDWFDPRRMGASGTESGILGPWCARAQADWARTMQKATFHVIHFEDTDKKLSHFGVADPDTMQRIANNHDGKKINPDQPMGEYYLIKNYKAERLSEIYLDIAQKISAHLTE